ncbi:MAG: hypothetical protein SA339_04460 [Methanomassiliicoccus sp.]|nr:hypothetical protein [Methanomassiliicoccus sp.]
MLGKVGHDRPHLAPVDGMSSKLRVGLLLDGASVPYWAARSIERMAKLESAEIVLVVVDGGTEKPIDPTRATESFLYDTYIWLDRRKNRQALDPLAREDLPKELDKAGRVYLKRTADPHRTISEEVVSKIKEKDLDVLIDIGKVTPLGELSRCARQGVWSFSAGDGESYDGHSPGFWEIYHHEPITSAHVRRICGGTTSIIYISHSHTITRSEKKNRDQLYIKGISFLPRLLDEQSARGNEPLTAKNDGTVTDWGPLHRSGPGNLDMLSFYLRRLPRDLTFLTKRALFEERWGVMYSMDGKIPSNYSGFKHLVPPPHTWWGDPMVAQDDKDFYIFVEELVLPRSRNHAHISVIKVDAKGGHQAPVTVLERPYHLSYPFVFQWKGTHYMVPESSNNRTIELYEATEFPYNWKPVKEIMTGVSAVDTTLVRRNGLWWMFTNIRENEGGPINDELFLFYSEDLLADRWEPHPLNPIISDASTARPAGRIFEMDGVLYRPSQDCSRCYGYAVNINRIQEMDEKSYRETRTAYLEPKEFPGASRVHTFSHIHGLTAVDTYIARSRFIPNR